MITTHTKLPEGWIVEDGYPYSGFYLIHECADEKASESAEVTEELIGLRYRSRRNNEVEVSTICANRCTCGAVMLTTDLMGWTGDDVPEEYLPDLTGVKAIQERIWEEMKK